MTTPLTDLYAEDAANLAAAPTLYLPRVAAPDEAKTMIGDTVPDRPATLDGPALVRDADTGALVAAYLPLRHLAPVRQGIPGIRWCGVQRAKTYRSKSQTFGYAPRRPLMKRESCRSSSIATDQPDLQAALDAVGARCERILRAADDDAYQASITGSSQVLDDWKMGESELWTSGVINHTAQLPYHRDSFNFPVWSAMPVLRRGTSGGRLHLPEYDLVLPCADQTASFFMGQELVHGVTPIQTRKKDGYRYSVVFYALKGMKDCYTYAKETAYGQRKRTERERDIARRLAAGDTGIPGHENRPRPAPESAESAAESCAEAADMAENGTDGTLS